MTCFVTYLFGEIHVTFLSSILWLFSCCVVSNPVTPWTAAHQASLSSTISQSLFKYMSSQQVMLSNHLIVYCPFLLLPLIFSSIRVFSSELSLYIRWPKYWSLSFIVSPAYEYSGMISFGSD